MTPDIEKMLKKLRDPDKILDLLIFATYNAGHFQQKIPVDESRRIFAHIKKLLTKKK